MKKHWMFIFVLSVLLASFTTFAYCAETISIGYSGPLSGGAARYGTNNLHGIQQAIDEINGAGGITVGGKTYTFKLTYLDDKYKPAETVSNVRRMLTTVSPKPIAIFCPHSGGILAIEKFNEREKVLIHGYTDNVAILKQGNKLVVKAPMSMAFYNSGPADMGWENGYRKVALLCGAHEAGKMAEKIFQVQWKDKGGEVTSVDSIDFRTVTDFYPFLTKALSKNPDCIFLYGPSEPTAMLVSQARELGFKGGFLLGSQCKLDEMAKVVSMEILNNSIGVCPVGMMPLPMMQKYNKSYRDKFGADAIPTSESAFNYEVMYIIAEAMKKSGSVTDTQKIRKAIGDVLPVGEHAIRGINKVTPEGQFISGYFAIAIRDNKFVDPINIDPAPWYKKYGATWMGE
ncbi:MAG: ABC transporter substrate-binding protein [Deltaproteobacteria bacterium]|nr:ABC transporter substrate-binding protein [Deltaproteobacteria bacterium]